jgi:hypothetical protein
VKTRTTIKFPPRRCGAVSAEEDLLLWVLWKTSYQVIILSSCDFIVLIFGINYGFSEMGFVNWYAGHDYQAILVRNQSRLRIY